MMNKVVNLGPEYDRILSTFEEWLTHRQIEHYDACAECQNSKHGQCPYALALKECENKLTAIWTTIRFQFRNILYTSRNIFLHMEKTKGIALVVAVATIMLSVTTTINVKATTEEDNDGPALTMNKESSNPSGEKVKDIQSNENSENAAIKIERSQNHEVRGEPSDEPTHTSTRTVERGDTITQITRESAPQSSAAAGISESEDNDFFN